MARFFEIVVLVILIVLVLLAVYVSKRATSTRDSTYVDPTEIKSEFWQVIRYIQNKAFNLDYVNHQEEIRDLRQDNVLKSTIRIRLLERIESELNNTDYPSTDSITLPLADSPHREELVRLLLEDVQIDIAYEIVEVSDYVFKIKYRVLKEVL